MFALCVSTQRDVLHRQKRMFALCVSTQRDVLHRQQRSLRVSAHNLTFCIGKIVSIGRRCAIGWRCAPPVGEERATKGFNVSVLHVFRVSVIRFCFFFLLQFVPLFPLFGFLALGYSVFSLRFFHSCCSLFLCSLSSVFLR